MKSNRLLHHFTLLLAGTALLFSCNKSKNAPAPNMGFNYFPLKVSSVVIYDVDSTVYNNFNNSITNYVFQLKDEVTNKFTDGQGNEAYRIERYKKTGTQDWAFQKVIVRKIISNRAEEYIDNKRYVRLVFPPSAQSNWNGNLYNDLGEWRHEVKALDVPLTIGTNQLDSTIAIHQYNEVNLIREDIYDETYAKNIGLVVKEVKALDKNISTGVITKGFKYKMQLNSWK
ncbi:MAG: hypothetical protein EOO47_20785 [Flavobacterium sp.]|nr:MAG: hypothetical protein EOO47_20785 [Flavobacterium sp.]